jgi:hypothetical protein
MCTGIAIAAAELPTAFCEDPRLVGRLYRRGELDEVQFHWWQRPSLLPVRWSGALQLLPWGSRNRRDPLPYAKSPRTSGSTAGPGS